MSRQRLLRLCWVSAVGWGICAAADIHAAPAAQMVPLAAVRLLDGPFANAVKADQTYLLAAMIAAGAHTAEGELRRRLQSKAVWPPSLRPGPTQPLAGFMKCG